MKRSKKLNSYTLKLSAAMTVGMLVAQSGSAFAATNNASTVANNIMTSSGSFPALINTFAYIGGIGLGVAGVFKLKQHVDNPGQAPMKDALMRLAAGGALLALPFLTNVIMGSVSAGDTSSTSFSGSSFTSTFSP